MYTDGPWTFVGVQHCANRTGGFQPGFGVRKDPASFFEGGVPDLRTERAEKPIPSASNPSTWGGLLWTGQRGPKGYQTPRAAASRRNVWSSPGKPKRSWSGAWAKARTWMP